MANLEDYTLEFERLHINATQKRSIERFLDFVIEGLSNIGVEVIEEVRIEPAAFHNEFWLVVKTTYSEAQGTLLDALSSQYWMICVGQRGRLDAHMYPQSFKQFIGKRRLHHSRCRFIK